MWPPNPEILISPKVWQMSSKFQRQTWGFRRRRARRECPWTIPIMTDNRKWPPKPEILISLKLWQRALKFKRRVWGLRSFRARKRVDKWLQPRPKPEIAIWLPKPEILLGLELWQIASTFQRQIWHFFHHDEFDKSVAKWYCGNNGSTKWKRLYCYFRLSIVFAIARGQFLRARRGR